MSTKRVKGRWEKIIEDAAFGFVLGALFPAVATIIAMVALDLVPSPGAAWLVHRSDPLLQVIDTMPLILMVAFGLVGRGRHQLDLLITELEARVEQRTSVLASAREAAERDDRRRNQLLARTARDMSKRIEKIIATPLPEQSPWSWEPLLEFTRRLGGLAALAAGHVSQATETFEPRALVDDIRAGTKSGPTSRPAMVFEVDPEVPDKLEGKPALLAVLVESAVQLVSGLAPSGTTTLEVAPRWAGPGTADGLYLRVTNDRATGSIKNLKEVLAGLEVSTDIDAGRELLAVTLRTYAATLDAEVATRSSSDGGTTLSIVVPVATAPTAAVTSPDEAARDSVELPVAS
jgi:hypothetical protein